MDELCICGHPESEHPCGDGDSPCLHDLYEEDEGRQVDACPCPEFISSVTGQNFCEELDDEGTERWQAYQREQKRK